MRPGSQGQDVAMIVLLSLFLASTPAVGLSEAAQGAALGWTGVEILVPDVGVEVNGDGDAGLLLTVPVVWSLARKPSWELDVFVEPQVYVRQQAAFRGLVGSRFTLGPYWGSGFGCFFVEGGALVEWQGVGGFGGLGVSVLRHPEEEISMGGVFYRVSAVGGDVRHSVHLDLMRLGLSGLF
jgi:hypothetical protein